MSAITAAKEPGKVSKVLPSHREKAMHRIFGIVLASLCIAPGALILFFAALSKAPTGHERPQVQLAKDWTLFPPADRANCLKSTGSTGAYTDLLKCLEIKRDANSESVPKKDRTRG